jgi:prephenate dehydrogenase
MSISSVKIVGSGLIGTSIGLALSQEKIDVLMADSSLPAAELAQSLVNPGRISSNQDVFDLVVIAVPPSSFAEVIRREFAINPTSTFVDILSVKTKPQVEVEALGELSAQFVGSHPMAGREVSGPQSARGDLFIGRTWIICPSAHTATESLNMVKELIEVCGGVPIEMDPREHDQAMALVSHGPQILASVIAGSLNKKSPRWLELIGQGFKDLTRIADSDSLLWRDILSENADNVSSVLASLRRELESIELGLHDPLIAQKVIEEGNTGRTLIPGKHGSAVRKYIYLHIVIDDKAGQLAAIFNDCATAGVNIEDVSIEHTPGHNTGLVTLSILDVRKAEELAEFLGSVGWKVHSTSK